MSTTTIQVTTKTRDELRALGKMGDDYNSVIQRLIAEHKRRNLDEDIKKWDKLIKEHPEQFVSIDEL